MKRGFLDHDPVSYNYGWNKYRRIARGSIGMARAAAAGAYHLAKSVNTPFAHYWVGRTSRTAADLSAVAAMSALSSKMLKGQKQYEHSHSKKIEMAPLSGHGFGNTKRKLFGGRAWPSSMKKGEKYPITPKMRKQIAEMKKKIYTPGSRSGRAKRVTNARSAGFISRPRKRPSRQVSIMQKDIKLGVAKQYEYGNIVKDSVNAIACRYIGHSLSTISQARELFFMALLKRLAIKMGIPFGTWDDEIRNIAVSDAFIISYLADGTSDTTESLVTASIASIVTVPTWRFVAIQLGTNFPAVANETYVFISIRFVPNTANTWQTFDVDLRDASISYHAKSALKLQNRSITITGDVESDDIDNVPLSGRSFEGTGMSTTISPVGWRNASGYQSYAISSNVYGLIVDSEFQGTGASIKVLSEPPLPSMVHPCNKSGKIRLEPGAVQTSVLTGGFGGTLDHFYSKLCAVGGGINPGANPTRTTGFGKYRFFALEKMVDCIGWSAVNAIVLGTELQSELSAVVKLRKKSVTSPDNFTGLQGTIA